MLNADRSALINAFVTSVATRLGEQLTPDDLQELERLSHELLENQRILSAPRPQHVIVLLADLRGFSAISATTPPLQIIEILNRYFGAMSSIIQDYDGAIDKFMGDSVMALFGVPEPRDDDLQRALCCAVRMQQAMLEINQASVGQGLPEIYAGIGINGGEVMTGSFGCKLHHEYTVIGDDVNLAARIEGYSLRGQILLSEQCYQQAAELVEIGSVNQVRVKGKEQPVKLYELLAITSPLTETGRLEVPSVEVRKSPRLVVDLPFDYRQVRSKQLTAGVHRGRILDIGYNGMLAQLEEELPAFHEIAFNPNFQLTTDQSNTLYAKVLRSRPRDEGFLTNLEFTSLGTPGHQAVKDYVDQFLWGR